jgi:hypothetical protein
MNGKGRREAGHAKLLADPAWRRFAQTYGNFLVRRRNNVAAGVLFTGPGEPEIIRLR